MIDPATPLCCVVSLLPNVVRTMVGSMVPAMSRCSLPSSILSLGAKAASDEGEHNCDEEPLCYNLA